MPDGELRYLKHAAGEAATGLAAEYRRLRWLAGRIPAPRIIKWGEERDHVWLLTEALPGRSAGDLIAGDRSLLPAVVTGIADFLARLHGLPVDDCPFDASIAYWLPEARRRVAAGAVDEEDFDPDHRGWSSEQVLEQVEALAGRASGRVVVHGDFTLGNLIVDDRGVVTGCIDVGRSGVADPYQDFALCWRDLGGFGSDAQSLFLDAIGHSPPDRQRMLLHRSLDELF